MATVGISIIIGVALGLVTAVIAIRWPFAKNKHWVWQLPIFAVVLFGMTVWAWDAGHSGFPATFGPFVLVLMAMGTRMRPARNELS